MDILPPEILTQNIMLQLPYIDLQNYCQTHTGASNLCNDMLFWKTKLDYDFTIQGTDGKIFIPSKYITRYKVSNESWKQVYHRWYNNQNNLIYMGTMYTDQVIWYLDTGVRDTKTLEHIFILAIKYNNTKVLSKLYSKYKIPSINEIVTTSKLNVLATTSIETIRWFILHNQLSKDIAIMIASTYGRLDILQLLGQYAKHLTHNDMYLAIQNGHLNIVEWAIQHNILPNQNIINYTAEISQFEILDWLANKGMLPGVHAANFAVQYNLIPVLQWLIRHKIYPTQAIINQIAIQGQVQMPMLQWIWYNLGMLPDDEAVANIVYDYDEIAAWVNERNERANIV